MRKKNWKKILIPNIPYLFIALFATKIGQAVRLAPGTDFSGKALHMMEGVRDAFASPMPSFHPADLGIGICIAAAMRLAVYIKGKNAKKFRHNQEYGSARWGTAADIAPYVDPAFENNIILTQTESLTMNNRPADPRTARNKNVLIIGGSGSGKTTFVNAVTGYEKAHAEIKQGDLDVYEDYSRMKYEIGMVPQQELLRGDDTVIMTLTNAAQMRLPEGTPTEERKKRVEEVLALFGLTPVKDELVDKLSGGQRKRLSISVEFVSNPSLFVLDEPDSGLDGVMARDLMEQLRKIANQQKIVMVITGADKADILHKVFFGPVTPEVPGSILQFHSDVTLICDEAAAARMPQ